MAIGVLGAGQAQALVVNVNGQNWNVTTFTGSYNANTSKFNTAANGGMMPWWGNLTLANSFALAVGGSLGLPIFDVGGPLFGTSTTGTLVQTRLFNSNTNAIASLNQNFASSSTLAQAELVPPVPGPLPALGAAAAFGFSRKLRKRINAGANPASSTYSLS